MTETRSPDATLNPLGCAGISALIFAASPSLALGLMALAEHGQRQGRPTGGGPVAVGVPPIWFIWLILFGLSIPWIVAGVLLLRRHVTGRWIALMLTLPTAVLTVLTGIGTIVGMNARDPMTAKNVSAFGPVAFGGMLFCLTVWSTEIAARRSVKTRPAADPQRPTSES